MHGSKISPAVLLQCGVYDISRVSIAGSVNVRTAPGSLQLVNIVSNLSPHAKKLYKQIYRSGCQFSAPHGVNPTQTLALHTCFPPRERSATHLPWFFPCFCFPTIAAILAERTGITPMPIMRAAATQARKIKRDKASKRKMCEKEYWKTTIHTGVHYKIFAEAVHLGISFSGWGI